MDEVDRLLEEILVDANRDGAQLTSFETAFVHSARFPFPARIVGSAIDVVKVEFEGDERRGLVAVCRRDGETDRISLADLTPGPVTMATSHLLGAYRRWLGLPPAEPLKRVPEAGPWVYRTVASRLAALAVPLALRPMGAWHPEDVYWGEDGEERDPIIEVVIASGPRPCFEMEQVIPGVDDDDFDLDAVTEAAELHRSGFDREASRILKGLIDQDERCLDAWVHPSRRGAKIHTGSDQAVKAQVLGKAAVQKISPASATERSSSTDTNRRDRGRIFPSKKRLKQAQESARTP